jgi:hypothetical protein
MMKMKFSPEPASLAHDRTVTVLPHWISRGNESFARQPDDKPEPTSQLEGVRFKNHYQNSSLKSVAP